MGRHNLYMFRCNMKLTQEEIAAKIGVSRSTYRLIENGKRWGTLRFWSKLQKAFNVTDVELVKLQKIEERTEQ